MRASLGFAVYVYLRKTVVARLGLKRSVEITRNGIKRRKNNESRRII